MTIAEKKVVKEVVDRLLELHGMPTYSQVREVGVALFNRDCKRGHAWIGDECEQFEEIQNVLRNAA